jgi:putative hydrolase of the HAD superfamily
MHPPNIRAIIFDFGNVIGLFDYNVALAKIAPHSGLSLADISQAIDASGLEDDYESGRITSAVFLRELRQLCRLSCAEEFLQAAWCDIFQPNQDVCALIPRLASRYRLVLGSNTNALHAAQFQKQFADVLTHFAALVLSHEVGHRKPRAEFFQRCRELAGCAPAECVFIDDLPANIAGARECGLHGIVYRDVEDLQQRLAELGIR